VTVVEGILPSLNIEAVVLVLDVMVEISTLLDVMAPKLTLKPPEEVCRALVAEGSDSFLGLAAFKSNGNPPDVVAVGVLGGAGPALELPNVKGNPPAGCFCLSLCAVLSSLAP
jgi:hypothetical protein